MAPEPSKEALNLEQGWGGVFSSDCRRNSLSFWSLSMPWGSALRTVRAGRVCLLQGYPQEQQQLIHLPRPYPRTACSSQALQPLWPFSSLPLHWAWKPGALVAGCGGWGCHEIAQTENTADWNCLLALLLASKSKLSSQIIWKAGKILSTWRDIFLID